MKVSSFQKDFKKSQMGSLGKMILLAASAVLLIILITGKASDLFGKSPIEICKISVVAQASTKGMPTFNGFKSIFSIECFKKYVIFYNKKVEKGDNPSDTKPIDVIFNGRKTKKIPELNDYVVNQVIAEEMRMCFYQFAEGKVHVFNQEFWKNSNVCFVCSQINFDQPGKKYVGFMEYIKKADIKDGDFTYYKYFDQPSVSQVPWFISNYRFTKNGAIEFNSTNTYYVVFVKEGKKFHAAVKSLAQVGDPAISAAAALWDAAWNDNANNYGIYVIDNTQLNDVCEIEAT